MVWAAAYALPPRLYCATPGSQGFDPRKAGPWADCVKSVAKLSDGTFKYTLSDLHPEYELPCIPFKNERGLMEDYASRNWTTCFYPSDPNKPQLGCHNTFHFDDVAIDPANDTVGGNSIQDQNINLHAEWDDIPTDIGDAATRELLAAARAVPASPGRPDDWPAA